MFRSSSIRWTLSGWYGLLLATVLLAFGAVLYQRIAAATMEGVDASLLDRGRALAAAVDLDEHDGWELDLSEDYLRGLAVDTYLRVWGPANESILALGDGGPSAPRGIVGLRDEGDRREVELTAMRGARVLVGRLIATERARLASLRSTMILCGLGVLVLALAGGFFLARRSLAPVERMALTAAAITEKQLSTRLDEGDCPEEVRGLAHSFNGILARLEEAFERQARFTADASHELRTPLAILRAQAEQALRKPRSPEEYRAALEACVRAAERMTGLVESLLALARADAGEEPDWREDVELGQLVRESTDLLRPTAEEARVELHCRPGSAHVRGDARLLGDLVTNLVDNGLRYNRVGGRVDVELERENGAALLSVRDTGLGIPLEQQARLFERFHRGDPSRSRERPGFGLGLAIARAIVEAHGGSIEVASDPGNGSCFTVRLPASEAHPQ